MADDEDATRDEIPLGDIADATAVGDGAATGVVGEVPAVPGVRERWGREAVIGALATGPSSAHQALLFTQ